MRCLPAGGVQARNWLRCGPTEVTRHDGSTEPGRPDLHPAAEADPADEDPRKPVEVSFYYGTDDAGKPAGKIAPHPEFGLSQDRGMLEPRITVSGGGERKGGRGVEKVSYLRTEEIPPMKPKF